MQTFPATTSYKSNTTAGTTGIEFWGFVCYLLFIFFNPQNFFPFIKPLRPALVIALFTFVIALLNKNVRIYWDSQTKLLAIFLIIVTASTINSISSDKSFIFLQMYLRTFFLYLLFIMIAQSEISLQKIIWVMISFLFINTVITLISSKTGLIPYYRLESISGEGPNDFALMILAILPFPISLMQKQKSIGKKGFLILATVSSILCLTRTRSRMGFYGLLVLLAQIGWIKRKKPAFIIMIAGLVIFAFLNTHYAYWQRVREVSYEETKHSRLYKWQQAIEVMKLRPFLGVGPGSFITALNQFNLEGEKEHVVHNAFLEVGAENGIFALFIYLTLTLISIRGLLFAESYFRQEKHNLFNICQAVRMGIITLCFTMMFLSQQYNHFYYIFIAMSVILKNLALKDKLEKRDTARNWPNEIKG